jgi:hypothetical protein
VVEDELLGVSPSLGLYSYSRSQCFNEPCDLIFCTSNSKLLALSHQEVKLVTLKEGSMEVQRQQLDWKLRKYVPLGVYERGLN